MNPILIENRKGKLKLNDGVHKESADKLIEELGRLYGPAAVAAQMRIGDVVCSADDALESVEVEINSPGGSVLEGTRIYNALREMSARGVHVSTTVNGLAASMGSVILMAGDERNMTQGSRIMIHEASTYAWGDARAMRKNADLLEGISAEIAGIYAERTGGDAKAIRDMMHAETWMTADQAKENGFVHNVIKDGKKQSDAKAEFDTPPLSMKGILAKLFPGNEEAEKIEAALIEAETLRADLEAAQARIDELAPLAEANANLQAEVAEITGKLSEAEHQLNANAQTIADLQAQVSVTDEKVAHKAAELLAATGQPAPVAIEDDGITAKSYLQTFESLTGSAATEYWKKHRREIKAEQSKANK